MAVLSSMEYSNFDDIYTSLTKCSNNKCILNEPKIDNFTSIVQTVNETGILVDPDLVIVETLPDDVTRMLKEGMSLKS
jgi:repressor of nif and glnA expression